MTDGKHERVDSSDILPEDEAKDLALDKEQEKTGQQPDNGDHAIDDNGQLADQDAMHAKIESLQAELAESEENLLRAYAEAENTRRRAERNVEHAHKYGLEKFCQALLPVIDSLERASDIMGNENSDKNQVETNICAIKEGVDLTLTMFTDVRKKFELDAIDPVGEPFDPNFHEAMSMLENDEVEPNTVLNVLQRGYSLNGRLIRPAMVIVSKAKKN